MASETDIANLALQLLGANRIADIDENSANARACRECYSVLRDGELRSHPWNFAIARAQLAEDAAAPTWGKDHQYQLPSDFIRLLSDYEEDNDIDTDRVIEGRFIVSDESSPIYIRYIKRVTDTSHFDPNFIIALAAKMAAWMCERITQSNSKKADAKAAYKDAIVDAKRTNGIEKRPQVSYNSEWIDRRS